MKKNRSIIKRSLFDEIDDLFDFFEERFFPLSSISSISKKFVPKCDLEETEDSFIITAEVPGIEKEDLKITVDEDGITISGERKREKEEKEKTYHRIERSFGKFQRYISFPKEVKPDQARATYKNGILRIEVPKDENSKSKEIEIEFEE